MRDRRVSPAALWHVAQDQGERTPTQTPTNIPAEKKALSGTGQGFWQSAWAWVALLVVQAVFLAVLLACYIQDLTVRNGNETIVVLDIACILMAMLFYLSILRSNSKKQDAQLFMMLLALNTLYLFMDGCWHFVQDVPSLRVAHILVNVVYLLCPVVITLAYWRFLDMWVGRSEAYYHWANAAIKLIAGVQAVLTLLSPVTGWFFVISQDGNYIRGPLYILTIVLPYAMVLVCIGRILFHRMPLVDRAILLAYLLPPLIAAIVQGMLPGTTVLAAATFVFVALLFTNYYIRKEAEITELKYDLTKSELKSLQMQINPHFLYNTLHSVAGLCETDPQAAQEMTYRLASYMRDNFTDIEKPHTVTFAEELVQLDHYLDIESMRFPNITVEKDIPVSDFPIPVSTLQPLVENAIKHGIGKRKKGMGTIAIASRETGDAWQVCVTDNGVGCSDSNLREPQAGHFGLENVRKRLKILCNGELDVASTPGQGTVVRITIPKNSGARP